MHAGALRSGNLQVALLCRERAHCQGPRACTLPGRVAACSSRRAGEGPSLEVEGLEDAAAGVAALLHGGVHVLGHALEARDGGGAGGDERDRGRLLLGEDLEGGRGSLALALDVGRGVPAHAPHALHHDGAELRGHVLRPLRGEAAA
eukprot:915939-Rhodomonas_salina.1